MLTKDAETVPESIGGFFRDAGYWTFLHRHVLLRVGGTRATDPVRVWVAGCGSGGEAYSIAILLLGRALTQVVPTDVDSDLLPHAELVLERLAPVTGVVRTRDGHRYDRSLRRSRTRDGRIDGVVITFVDRP
jgi:chemotaxis methyl-accepting protein methylase